MMSIKNYFKIKYPCDKDKTRFIIEYEGYGVRFFTEVDEVDESCAIGWFKKFYPSAKFIAISKKL